MENIKKSYKNSKSSFKISTPTWRIIFCIKTFCTRFCILYKILSRTLTPEIMKLLGSTKSKTLENENGENVPQLEITEEVHCNCNIVNYCKLSIRFKSLVYIYSKKIVWSIIRHFTQKLHIFKILWFRVLIYWSVVCCLKV